MWGNVWKLCWENRAGCLASIFTPSPCELCHSRMQPSVPPKRIFSGIFFREKCCIQFHYRAEMLIRIHSFQTISSIKYFSFLYRPSLQTKRIFWLLTNKKLIIDSLIMSGSNLISWLLVPEHPSWGEKGIQEWQYNFTAYGSHLFISRYHKALNIPVCFFLQRNVWIIKIQTIWQAVSLCREGFMLNDRQMFGEPKESPLPSCLPLLSLTLNS